MGRFALFSPYLIYEIRDLAVNVAAWTGLEAK